MPASFHATIVLPDGLLHKGNVTSLVAPAETGYLGVLAHHAPMIALLAPGRITLREESGNPITFDSTGGGVMEVSDNKAVLILDSIR